MVAELRVDEISCPHCGRNGNLHWERAADGKHDDLVKIDGGFYERLAKKPPFPIELVCGVCGTTLRKL